MPSELLEQHAQRCIQLAYQCQNKSAERLMRLLAADLMLAAGQQRPRPKASVTDQLDALAQLSRQAAASNVNSESASKA